MEKLARVRVTYEDGTALVTAVQKSACSGECYTCAGCGGVRQAMLLRAANPIGASPGELVTLTADPGPVLGAVWMYLMPPVMFFAGYFAGDIWNVGKATGFLAWMLGIAAIVAYHRFAPKKKRLGYTITGYPSADVLESQIKGDNDLD